MSVLCVTFSCGNAGHWQVRAAVMPCRIAYNSERVYVMRAATPLLGTPGL